ncbi:MAG: hypothetical protein KGJ34_01485 [Patescibacteria group bacterium]|nr:hypothetical protein [Patescibacteria group bacterium]
MEKQRTTPKDFFLWAGAMLSLYISVFSFISLLFDYIDYAFPDALSYIPAPYSGAIPFELSSLVILFPLFLVLTHLIRKDTAKNPQKRDLWVRRWALVFTVFIAGATVVIDLITLLTNFLSGNFTIFFLLKVLVILLIAGAGLLHFLADIWGYWDKEKNKSRLVGWGAGIVVICTVIAGFLIMGAPWNVRLYRFDEQKVNDLQNIQYQIVSYWQQEQKLPASLSDLKDSLSGYSVPLDSQTNEAYEYSVTGRLSFELCANFNAQTQAYDESELFSPTPVGVLGSGADSWYHGSGKVCFDRTIDPSKYPPIKQ